MRSGQGERDRARRGRVPFRLPEGFGPSPGGLEPVSWIPGGPDPDLPGVWVVQVAGVDGQTVATGDGEGRLVSAWDWFRGRSVPLDVLKHREPTEVELGLFADRLRGLGLLRVRQEIRRLTEDEDSTDGWGVVDVLDHLGAFVEAFT